MDRKTLVFYGVMGLLVGLVIEAMSFAAVRYLTAKGVYYELQPNPTVDQYLVDRHQVLGWPAPNLYGAQASGYDSEGGRSSPNFPISSEACISLYGDSFTWSDEVDHEHAWSSRLSQLTGCRVANFGVGGYGTDQALIRYQLHDHPGPKLVFLNHLSENIIRNTNQFRDLLHPESALGFKPRFVVVESTLRRVPLPTFTPQQYLQAVKDPNQILEHEFFLPGGDSGVSVQRFPFSVSLLRGLGHFRVHSRLTGTLYYAAFYEPSHPAGGLEVTAEILQAFHDLARERGQVPVITLIPTGPDLTYFDQHGRWTYQPLIDELQARNLDALNFGNSLIDHLQGADPCILFDVCSAHFNEQGYELLAQIAFDHLSLTEETQASCREFSSAPRWCQRGP